MSGRGRPRHYGLAKKVASAIGDIFGKRIEERRSARHQTQGALGSSLPFGAVTRARVDQVEKNLRGLAPTAMSVYSYAMALDCEPADLIPTVDEVAERSGMVVEAKSIQVISFTARETKVSVSPSEE